ncbi:MAG: hypothetical protein K0S65_4568, partial [Labilithrix sp.]|nr:hypothetical protein [Labilithrix sp.]
VNLDPETVRLVKMALKSRLAHGKAMTFFGDRRKTVRPDGSLAVRSQVNLVLRPESGRSEIIEGDDGGKLCVLRLDATAIAELASTLDETPGTYVLSTLTAIRFVVAA